MKLSGRIRACSAAFGALVVSAASLVVPGSSAAQSVCKPAASTNEAKLLAFFAAPMAFAAAPEVLSLARGEVAIAGELTAVPRAPAAINASSGACGFEKSENSALSPVFPRPRVALGLGNGFVVEASWLPPVTVADATPNLGAIALAWTPAALSLPFDAALTFRVHGTFGGVNGPVTCPRDQLQLISTKQSCYGSEPSDDTYDPNVRGAEIVASRESGAWRWYGGAGVNAIAARFVVDFTDQGGFVDNNVVEISLARAALMAGASWQAHSTLAFSAQLYSVPTDATTGRLGIAWRVR
ncbi:MAG: hypothetical protein O2973_11260 [Gemmatimonadetes bacterium]|nr:hypothetical protein [Gemmatimonadota bacterium]